MNITISMSNKDSKLNMTKVQLWFFSPLLLFPWSSTIEVNSSSMNSGSQVKNLATLISVYLLPFKNMKLLGIISQ